MGKESVCMEGDGEGKGEVGGVVQKLKADRQVSHVMKVLKAWAFGLGLGF